MVDGDGDGGGVAVVGVFTEQEQQELHRASEACSTPRFDEQEAFWGSILIHVFEDMTAQDQSTAG